MRLRRRGLLGLAAAALFLPSRALPQAKPRQIGLLHLGIDHVPPAYRPLLEGMGELGYRDGVNVVYDFRNAADEQAALREARDLAKRPVDLIVAFDSEAAEAAHAATASIPIVIVHGGNPVATGLAKSLAHPGGNVTGFAGRKLLVPKEMQLVKELAPKLRRVLLLFDARDAASVAARDDSRPAAQHLGVALVEREVRDPAGLKSVFGKLKPNDAEVVLIASNPLRHRHEMLVLQLATARGMAMVGSRKDVVKNGALFSYAYDHPKIGRATAGRYIDPILKGAKPGELPIEEVAENNVVVNRRVAAKHGWKIPASFEARGAEIIE